MIPEKVKIGGVDFEVVQERGVCTTDNKKAYGTCEYTQAKIIIETTYPEQRKEQTLLHEALHAIDDEYQIGLSEKQINQITNGFYAFVVDNPMVFDLKRSD